MVAYTMFGYERESATATDDADDTGQPELKDTCSRSSHLNSPVPHRMVVGRVVGAVVGLLCRDTFVVEEDLRPVGPRRGHGIGEVRGHLFRIGSAVLSAQRVEVAHVVDRSLLHLRGL